VKSILIGGNFSAKGPKMSSSITQTGTAT